MSLTLVPSMFKRALFIYLHLKGYHMAGYNRVVMVGNLTRDPDYKQLASGTAVCRLGLATNRQFKNRQTGSMIQEVCYVDIDVWGAQAESCRQYLQKGRAILVEGRLKFDTWEDPNGQTRSKHSIVADRIVFLGMANEAQTDVGVQSDTFSTQNSAVGQGAASSNDTLVASQAPQSDLEKELLDQIDQIKTRTQSVQPAKKEPQKTTQSKQAHNAPAAPTGEIDFKDQPPFEDDLPF